VARVDLHCHSRFSDRPSDWFLQRIGAAESYTDPETVYATAKSRGMDFVTLTDHNSIAGTIQLMHAHPGDVIVGVETTTYFPRDRCKIHLLMWGIDENQFDTIQDVRQNIFDLRDYVREQRIAHSVAHATYAVNDRLEVHHLEQLIVLFDNFEVVNGARTRRQNELWRHMLDSLTPTRLAELCRMYGLEPFGERPWEKGFTGGSDDHAGLVTGRCWTEASADSPEEFLRHLRQREIRALGRHNDYRTLAFSIYKIACDYGRTGRAPATHALLSTLGDTLFSAEEAAPRKSLRERARSVRLRSSKVGAAVFDLADALKENSSSSLDERLDTAYDRIAVIADDFFLSLVQSARAHVMSGDIAAFARDVSATIPALFLAAPFLSTMHVLNKGRVVAEEAARRFGVPESARPKQVLWFTDTLTDLNGVSVTLRGMADVALRRGHDIRIATCEDGSTLSPHDPRLLLLPSVLEASLPFYDQQSIQVPSVLNALRKIQDYDPDEIVISTPGPVGLLGLLSARLLGVQARSVYHTDFAAQLEHIGGLESAPVDIVEAYVLWFYGQADVVYAPTRAYARILEERGISPSKIDLFARGVDTNLFEPMPAAAAAVRREFRLSAGPVLAYAGRVSRDKRLGLLLDAFAEVRTSRPDANLLIIGDGPHMTEVRERADRVGGVVLTGALEHGDVAAIYPGCDVFVFPSVTDTFGMAVLEAQACGVPAVVSAYGGPCEVIQSNRTGLVVEGDSPTEWSRAISTLLEMREHSPTAYAAMRSAARENALLNSWDGVLDDLMKRRSCEPVNLRSRPVSANTRR